MSEPVNLGDSVISSADTGSVITEGPGGVGYQKGFAEAKSVLLSINFTYGSGGSTLKVVVETTPDQGTTWIEVYRAAFTTASGQRIVNLSALTAISSPYTPAALSDDTAKDGIIGDRFRVKKIVAGTYAGNSSLSVRATPHK